MSKILQMRIHRFGGPEVLPADEVEPSLPDAAQVLVTVKAASINPVDFKIRSGKYPAVKEDRLPYTLGRDASGIVEKCGAQATKFKVGDEVFGHFAIQFAKAKGAPSPSRSVPMWSSITRRNALKIVRPTSI
jgi:NADPH:quinone reductase-like Zn-dependent oxidoreductase